MNLLPDFFRRIEEKVRTRSDLAPVVRQMGIVRARLLLGFAEGKPYSSSTAPMDGPRKGYWKFFTYEFRNTDFFDEFKDQPELRQQLKEFLEASWE